MKAPILLAATALSIAQAAEPTGTVTLTCEGTASTSAQSPPAERQPVSVGIILNFADKTIALIEGASRGLGWTYPIKIDKVSELAISFGSADEKATEFMWGTVGRVSGDVQLYYQHNSGLTYYALKCKPSQRMF
jgi:hypothetical protein